MCGIIGGVNSQLQNNIHQQLEKIGHRGPDDRGVFVDHPIAFGHVRLSILDLSSHGHQPMQSTDGNYIIVYNGEIYNHIEIRNDLIKQGFQFHSTSDTETLLNAYIAYGEECLHMLNGIFAFAIYDKLKGTVFIARDHFGVKPLYFYSDEKQFLFCSELKGLLKIDGLNYKLQPEIFFNYLALLWSPADGTPFKFIRKLLPGHSITIDVKQPGNIKPEQYYHLNYDGSYDLKKTKKDWVEEFDGLLTTAVERQLLSDAPLGFFLSGGLDSSLITAIAKKINKDTVFETFTLDTGSGMKSEGFEDDLEFARKVAAYLGVRLNSITSNINISESFDKMIWQLDEPQADPAALFVRQIAEAAQAKDIKVLLSGTGADDVFSGYRRHQALYYDGIARQIPEVMKKGIAGVASLLNENSSRRIHKLLNNEHPADLYYWQDGNRLKSLFNRDVQEHIDAEFFRGFYEHFKDKIPNEKNRLNQMLHVDIYTFLSAHNLNYNDKMAMAAGVEVRVPYLDIDLVNRSAKLPPELKMKGSQTKYILREIAKKYLPEEIIKRKKTGFGAPVRSWVKNEMREMIEERLFGGQFFSYGIFDKEAVRKLVDDNASGRIDAAYSIFALLAVEAWLRQFEA